MAEGRFVSYLRVSTGKQGRSGLGLDAQRETVNQTLNGGDWQLPADIAEEDRALLFCPEQGGWAYGGNR